MGNVFESVKAQASNISVSPTVIQAGVIIVLVFLLILVMARITRTYIAWYTSGWYIWVILGFLLAVVIEGFFILGGTTMFTSILGWQSAPRPVQTVIDNSRTRLIGVLGAKDARLSVDTIIEDFKNLNESDSSKVKSAICEE